MRRGGGPEDDPHHRRSGPRAVAAAVVVLIASCACNRPDAVEANRTRAADAGLTRPEGPRSGAHVADAQDGAAATGATGPALSPIETRCSRDAECTAVGFEV